MEINFSGTHGLVQAVVQDERTNKILRVGYIDEATWKKIGNESLVYLLNMETKQPEIVTGGEYNKPLEMASSVVGEDGAAVVLMANPDGSTTGADKFLGNKNMEDLSFLSYLQDFIEKRKKEMPEYSYTTTLFRKGVNKISQKVGEEAVETIIEATNGTQDQFIYESSDLVYHLIVLLTQKGVRIEDLARELKARHKE